MKKARSDARPESHNIDRDSIELGAFITTDDKWVGRKTILKPLMRPSLCVIQRERDEKKFPTLGLFKPRAIDGLDITPCDAEWTSEQRAILNQQTLNFGTAAKKEELEKIPFEFHYRFRCEDQACKGHRLGCTDWEMAQAFRQWREDYGRDWEKAFREKFERQMIERFDTHFFVGTLHTRPSTWIIVGLFYPPKNDQGSLF